MNKITVSLLSLLLATAAAGPADPPSDNMIGASTANGRIAVSFINTAFNQHDMGRAFDLYVSRTDYMNHSFAKPGQKQTFANQRQFEIGAAGPGTRMEIEQVIAQGDLVALHIHAFRNSKDKLGDELAEFLRIRGGKIVDHWDLHIPVTAGSAQFAGLNRFGRR